ncbi:hypothetical protein ABFS83_08G240400 [Erythranthe nasuta]
MEAAVKNISPLPQKKENKDIKDTVKHIVLPFLPAKTLVRFKSVSKEWENWISSPFLVHEQSYYFKNLSGFFCQHEQGVPTFVSLDQNAYGLPNTSLDFLPEQTNILSSSSGLLLCQGQQENNPYYVCNPATQKWTEIPPHSLYHDSPPAIILAFEPSLLNMRPDYHLICAVPLLGQPVVIFEMYSSENQTWTILDSCVLVETGESLSFTGNGYYMKGIAYWETSNRKLLAVEPRGGVHEIISLPNDSIGTLTQIEGELCYISVCATGSKNGYCVRIYSGIKMGLKCKVVVHLDSGFDESVWSYYRVMPCLAGNLVMVLVGRFVYSCRITIGHWSVQVVSRADIDSANAEDTKYLAYVNSLVHVA